MGISNTIPPSRLIQPGVVANAAARPTSPFTGQAIYQVDTAQYLIWNGTAWTPPTNMPWGLLSTVTSTSTQSIGGGSFQDITSLTTSVTLVNGRYYQAIASITAGNPGSATAGLTFKCLFGATDVGTQGYNQRNDDAQVATFQGIYFFQATSSGAVTVKMQGQAYAQATSLSVSFSNHRLTIMDVGGV